MDLNELVVLANLLGIPVKRSGLWDSHYKGGPKNETESIQSAPFPFVLAHEIAHATGAHSRLKRRSITMYRPPGWWTEHHHSTIVRAEEAIADQVAACLTGQQRSETPAMVGAYPPVTPATQTEKYVNVRAYEALEYLMPYIQQIQERKAA